jgi:hypothetical protein
MKKEIVIAAYDKDLSWVDKLNDDVKITIYRKGTNNNNEKEIFLDVNKGRCVHTFFNHILINYDNLSEYTFFVQDYPFDHWENTIEVINGNYDDFVNNSQLTIGGYFGYHWNSITVPSEKGGIMWTLSNSLQHGNGKVLVCFSNGFPQDSNPNIDVDKYWRILFENEPPHNYEFIPGGHFGITKEHVKLRSREFYQKIVDILIESEHTPWVIERLECYIFNPNYKTKY